MTKPMDSRQKALSQREVELLGLIAGKDNEINRLRALTEKPTDIEALKKTGHHSPDDYISGWNDCIDHLKTLDPSQGKK